MPRQYLTPIVMQVMAEPSIPAASTVIFFVSSDGHMYSKDSSGIVRQITLPVTNVAPSSPQIGYLWVDTT